ncbi:MAG: murein biosynthesis integral membrane protein MurJ [Candidatus Wildermuthbacteria bacterium]|nr:murein biosynthesis integral membrane protein MurJ [Candidatus Wildermuthbacteria bacterium]
MTVSQFFNSKANSITLAAGLLFFSALLSRMLGLLRNALLSWRFGAGEETDIYLAAFRIPDFLYGIIVLGGLTAVFLPLFSEYMEKDAKEAWRFASNLLNVLGGALLVLAVGAFVFAPALVHVVAPGFSSAQQEQTMGLMRLMLLSPLLFGISSVFSGILQYFNKFLAYSITPILYNLGIVIGIVFLSPAFGVWGLGLGVVLGAFMHVLIQVPPAIASGFRWNAVLNFRHPSLLRVARLTIPRTVAAAGYHINLIIMTALASVFAVGSITRFTYANDIQFVPVGLIGISFAVAAFSSLSKLFAQKKEEEFTRIVASTLRQILFLVIPFSILLLLLRAQAIRLIYGTGTEFTWEDTRMTAAILGIFAFGIVFQSLIPYFARVFFAFQNTKTPTIISLVSVGLNVVFAFLFTIFLSNGHTIEFWLRTLLKLEGVEDIRVLALPLSLVLSGILQAGLLGVFLQKRYNTLRDGLMKALFNICIASVALAGAAYIALRVYGTIFPLENYLQVFMQAGFAAGAGVIAYIAVAFLLGIPEMLAVWQRVQDKAPFLLRKFW